MRLLHIGDDPEQRVSAAVDSASDYRADCPVASGEHVPLRRASADHRSGSSSGRQDAGAREMIRPGEAFALEPERYEFRALPMHKFAPGRRDFFKLLGTGIAGLAVTYDPFAMHETALSGQGFHNEGLPVEIGAWLHFGAD